MREEGESGEARRVGCGARAHGDVVGQIFAEQCVGKQDMIVIGSSRAYGTFQNYIMGDVTRDTLNRADCAVLVGRSDGARRGFWAALKGIFSA